MLLSRANKPISYYPVSMIGINGQGSLTFTEPEANCLATRRHVKGCVGIFFSVLFPFLIHLTDTLFPVPLAFLLFFLLESLRSSYSGRMGAVVSPLAETLHVSNRRIEIERSPWKTLSSFRLDFQVPQLDYFQRSPAIPRYVAVLFIGYPFRDLPGNWRLGG